MKTDIVRCALDRLEQAGNECAVWYCLVGHLFSREQQRRKALLFKTKGLIEHDRLLEEDKF